VFAALIYSQYLRRDKNLNYFYYRNKQLGEKKVKKNWTDDEISLLLWAARVQADRVNEDPSEFVN